MLQEEEKPTVLELTTTNNKIRIELPWDVDGEDLCNAFYTAAIGITFLPTSILHAMKEFAEMQLEILEPEKEDEEDCDEEDVK